MASGVNNVCRQIGTAFGIAFLGAILSNRYSTLVHDHILALRVPGLSPVVSQGILRSVAHSVQQAGTIAGSAGLPATQVPPAFRAFIHMPLFAGVQEAARTSFITGLDDILKLAAALLAVGLLASLVIKRADMLPQTSGQDPTGVGS